MPTPHRSPRPPHPRTAPPQRRPARQPGAKA
ncbi:TetR/AcrR family transcriptional regulator, partial [Streptomyces sp. FT05W]